MQAAGKVAGKAAGKAAPASLATDTQSAGTAQSAVRAPVSPVSSELR